MKTNRNFSVSDGQRIEKSRIMAAKSPPLW
jgi:hypothetical protein